MSLRVQGRGGGFVVVKAEGEKSMYQERGPCGQRGTGTEEGTNIEKRRNSKSRKGHSGHPGTQSFFCRQVTDHEFEDSCAREPPVLL